MGTSLVRSALVGTIAAIVAVIVVLLVADAVSGPLLVATPGSDVAEEVPLGGAVIFTALGGLVGMLLAWATSRFGWSASVFLGVCLVALVLYGIPPFSAAEETATALWLNVMHIAAAIPIVGSLYRWLTGRRVGGIADIDG